MNLPECATSHGLPGPEPAALECSRRLCEVIRAEIRSAGGMISFRRYMELALYAPGLGYYSAGSVKFGPEGDFTTAPELSPLFSACVARQCAQILEGRDAVILELGAGSGALAAGILDNLKAAERLPAEYLILEPSADLRRRQSELLEARLGRHARCVRWLDALPELPVRGVILANEVLDAMPAHRLRLGSRTEEIGVRWNGAGFEWGTAPAPAGLVEYARTTLDGIEALPSHYTTEFNTDLCPWIASLADVLEEGAILLFDYGYPRREYYHPERSDGTLICHYRHRAHADPFLHPGLQDMSVSVDFTAVAQAGAAAGLEVGGFTTQAHFLIGCGLQELPEMAMEGDERRRAEFIRQAKLLTLPGEMGERFKAIVLLRDTRGPLMGFSGVDHRPRLWT